MGLCTLNQKLFLGAQKRKINFYHHIFAIGPTSTQPERDIGCPIDVLLKPLIFLWRAIKQIANKCSVFFVFFVFFLFLFVFFWKRTVQFEIFTLML